MKHGLKKKLLCLIAAWTILFCFGFPVSAEETESFPIRMEHVTVPGAADSSVSYPVFSGSGEAAQVLAERLNLAVQSEARIPEYLQLLSTIQPGGTGLQVTYSFSYDGNWYPAAWLSILFSAEGKMLSGRPSQVYYPITLNMETGEPVAFEELFTDPDGAKAFIEAYLEEEVEPTLSTYLENNQLFPVPYERFFLDGFGRVLLLYENSQLSFLSGFSGAIAFRYSELWDWLDTSPEGIPMQVLWHEGTRYAWNDPLQGSFAEKNDEWIYNDSLYGLSSDIYIGQPLEEALNAHRPAADSGFYPGGAYYEVENPALRGTLILTDENETTVSGLLTSRVDHFGIETGKTSLADAEALMGCEPNARITVDDALAKLYLVCPGTAAAYSFHDGEGRGLSFTLYADENGIVQYIKLALK